MLQRWSVSWRERGYVTEVATLMEENNHVTGMASLMDGEWSCYRGGQFNGGRMVMLQSHFHGRSMVMLQRWSV